MLYLLLAIAASASMTLVLRVFREPKGNPYGLILGNYLTCILLAFLLLPDRSAVFHGSPMTLLLGCITGCLYVAGLVSMQNSVRINGTALTAAFSKLGLLVPLFLSLVVFGEKPGLFQLIGAALALFALVLLNSGSRGQTDQPASLGLLLLTLIACGSSDGMSKIFERLGSRTEDALFFFYLFTVFH